MANYLVRRVLLGAFTMWAISVVCFLIIQMPQVDFVDVYIERIFEDHQQFMTEEEAEALREFYGLDKPVFFQYWNWLGNLVTGNFGYSFDLQLPVRHLIANRLVLTIALTGMTILTTWVFSLPIGIYSALRQHSVGDYVVSFVGFLGLAVPDFLLALVLMFVAFKYFGVSVGGLFSDEYIQGPLPGELQWMGWSFQRVWNMLTHLWIPAIVLGTHGDGWPHQDHAQQPARRAGQALCGHGQIQGPCGLEGDPQVPGPNRPQPPRQRRCIPPAGPGRWNRHRIDSA